MHDIAGIGSAPHNLLWIKEDIMLNSHFSCYHPIKINRSFILYLFFIILIPLENSAWGKSCPGGCDDGNPCTFDFCRDGECVNDRTRRNYYPCPTEDDGNECTYEMCIDGDVYIIKQDEIAILAHLMTKNAHTISAKMVSAHITRPT
jgi:hypothetical protein